MLTDFTKKQLNFKFVIQKLVKLIIVLVICGALVCLFSTPNNKFLNKVHWENRFGLSAALSANIEELLPLCPANVSKSTLQSKVNLTASSFEDLERLHPELNPGGRYIPTHCSTSKKVAIIIPFRDRDEHLSIFLKHMHVFLQKQNLDYTIFVIEQVGWKFNRGKVFNIGFVEAQKIDQFPCFIFHDVDLLPEREDFMYTCYDQPRHMSVAVNKFNYKLPYEAIFGGVVALTPEQFEKVNGFSNVYYGWGGEDDDLSRRLYYAGLRIKRDDAEIARYTMILHENDTPNPKRLQKLSNSYTRWKKDGLSDLKYRVISVMYERLFIRIYVDILPPED